MMKSCEWDVCVRPHASVLMLYYMYVCHVHIGVISYVLQIALISGRSHVRGTYACDLVHSYWCYIICMSVILYVCVSFISYVLQIASI